MSVDDLRSRLHVGSAVCDLPPPTALVEQLLFVPGLSALYGPPKAGKTFFALGLGLAVATGRPFLGRSVKQSPVLYVAAEGVGGLGPRVNAWRRDHEVDDIDDIAFLTTAVNLSDRGAASHLGDLVVEFDVGLTIIDTFARCAVGVDENSSRDVGRVVESVDALRDRTGGHVQLVHHAGKDAARGMRGTNALLAAIDTAIEVTGNTRAVLRARVVAQKDAPAVPDMFFRLAESAGGVTIRTAGVDEVITGSAQIVFEALEHLPETDRTATKWQEMAESFEVPRSSFFEAKKLLLGTGRVEGGGSRGALYRVAEDLDLQP